MDLVKSAELFAKSKHAGQFRADGTTPYSKHLDDVVNRLKSLGVIDEQIFCAGWLHDTIEKTETTFDDLYEQCSDHSAATICNSVDVGARPILDFNCSSSCRSKLNG